MNKKLGVTQGKGCKTATGGGKTFPPMNWSVSDDCQWAEDTDITIGSAIEYTPCNSVTLSCEGQPPHEKVKQAIGVYDLLPSKYSAGRPVFKHSTRKLFLLVPNGLSQWEVRSSSVNGDTYICSAAAGDMRPDSHRNTNNLEAVNFWRYKAGKQLIQCQEIKLSCNFN